MTAPDAAGPVGPATERERAQQRVAGLAAKVGRQHHPNSEQAAIERLRTERDMAEGYLQAAMADRDIARREAREARADRARYRDVAQAAEAVTRWWAAMGAHYADDASSNRLGDHLDALAAAVRALGEKP